MIKRTVGYHAPHEVTLNLYTSLTRSILDYSSSVWSLYTVRDLKTVENVQRSMTRYITHYDGRNYQDRCVLLNILPLSYRIWLCFINV